MGLGPQRDLLVRRAAGVEHRAHRSRPWGHEQRVAGGALPGRRLVADHHSAWRVARDVDARELGHQLAQDRLRDFAGGRVVGVAAQQGCGVGRRHRLVAGREARPGRVAQGRRRWGQLVGELVEVGGLRHLAFEREPLGAGEGLGGGRHAVGARRGWPGGQGPKDQGRTGPGPTGGDRRRGLARGQVGEGGAGHRGLL
jgi:hypothetical protein